MKINLLHITNKQPWLQMPWVGICSQGCLLVTSTTFQDFTTVWATKCLQADRLLSMFFVMISISGDNSMD